MNLTIENVAYAPFSNIAVTEITPSLGGLVNYAPFNYNGTAISTSNPLQIGGYSSSLYRFSSGGNSGTTYSITITATTTNEHVITQTTKIVAEG
jgi:hypothetical protein